MTLIFTFCFTIVYANKCLTKLNLLGCQNCTFNNVTIDETYIEKDELINSGEAFNYGKPAFSVAKCVNCLPGYLLVEGLC